MSPRTLMLLVALACMSQTLAKPVRRKLNFNMFILRPRPAVEDRVLLTTNGVTRFGPILEYFLQRLQGMFSVRLPQDPPPITSNHEKLNAHSVPIADNAENEVDSEASTRLPGVVIKPSKSKPGTYEVEINVEVEDGQPETKTKN